MSISSIFVTNHYTQTEKKVNGSDDKEKEKSGDAEEGHRTEGFKNGSHVYLLFSGSPEGIIEVTSQLFECALTENLVKSGSYVVAFGNQFKDSGGNDLVLSHPSVSVVDSPFIPLPAFKVNHSFVTECYRAIGDLGGLGGFPISLDDLDRW